MARAASTSARRSEPGGGLKDSTRDVRAHPASISVEIGSSLVVAHIRGRRHLKPRSDQRECSLDAVCDMTITPGNAAHLHAPAELLATILLLAPEPHDEHFIGGGATGVHEVGSPVR